MGVTAGVAAVGNAVGGLASSIGQIESTERANENNLRIARENNALSEKLAKENNQLQVDMMRENNEFNRRMAIDMFDLETRYNRPLEQVKRYQEAGLNPAVMMEGAGAVASGNGDASTPTASPSGISPVMPTFTTPHMEAVPPLAKGFIDALNSLAQLKLANAEAKKTGAETREIDKLLDAKFADLTASAENKAAQAAYTDTMNRLESIYGAEKRDAEIKKLIQDATLAQLQGETQKAQKLFTDAERRLTNTKNKQLKEQAPFILANIKEQGKLYKEQQKTEKSKQAANYASAEESKARAKESDSRIDINREEYKRLQDTHDDFVRIQSLVAGKHALDFERARRTLDDFVDEMHNKKLISDAEYDKAKQLARMAEKDADWQSFEKYFSVVERLNNGVNKWAPWALSRDDSTPTPGQGMMYQSWQSTSTR